MKRKNKRSEGIITSYFAFLIVAVIGIWGYIDYEDFSKTAPQIQQIIVSEYHKTNDIKKAIKEAKKETKTNLDIKCTNVGERIEIHIYKEYGGKFSYNDYFYIEESGF